MLALFERIYRFITVHKLIPNGEKVLVAYSAGTDSTLLVRALLEITKVHHTGWSIELAYFNHMIDENDQKEEALAQNSAARWGIPLHLQKARKELKKSSDSLQMWARRERYQFLLQTAQDQAISYVATAHQLDDQAETVLMRAIEGSWLTALSGIPLRRPLAKGAQEIQVIRPLLNTRHSEILAALEELKEQYFQDPSNNSTSFTRNDVRNTLMPLILKNFNTGAREHLAALAQQSAELDVELTHRAHRLLPKKESNEERIWIAFPLDMIAFEARLQQRYFIREAMLELGASPREVTYRRVELALELIDEGRKGVILQLTGTLSACLEEENLTIFQNLTQAEQPAFEPANFHLAPKGGGWVAELVGAQYQSIRAKVLPNEEPALDKVKQHAHDNSLEFVDAAKIHLPLVARPRQAGDRFKPLGMDEEKKLQDYLVDRKIKRESRDTLPIICDALGIVWIAGHDIAERVRCTEATTQILKLEAVLEQESHFPSPFELEIDSIGNKETRQRNESDKTRIMLPPDSHKESHS